MGEKEVLECLVFDFYNLTYQLIVCILISIKIMSITITNFSSFY
jgi:hypothetical protein